MESKQGSFIALQGPEVPRGWTNDPDCLGIDSYFSDQALETKATLRSDYNIPNARPILADMSSMYLLDGGDGKYYIWSVVSEWVSRIEEPDLQKILATLKSEGLSALPRKLLNTEVTDDEKEEPKKGEPTAKKGIFRLFPKLHHKLSNIKK